VDEAFLYGNQPLSPRGTTSIAAKTLQGIEEIGGEKRLRSRNKRETDFRYGRHVASLVLEK